MRSRMSRGVPKWSGGKDLYMESCCSGSGKSSGFFGIVPGSFQKVSEDSGGVRRSGNCSTTSNTVAWAVGGRPSLNGPGAPAPPQGPCAWERENPKGECLPSQVEALPLRVSPFPRAWALGAGAPGPLRLGRPPTAHADVLDVVELFPDLRNPPGPSRYNTGKTRTFPGTRTTTFHI